jgi:hypothetical protein
LIRQNICDKMNEFVEEQKALAVKLSVIKLSFFRLFLTSVYEDIAIHILFIYKPKLEFYKPRISYPIMTLNVNKI